MSLKVRWDWRFATSLPPNSFVLPRHLSPMRASDAHYKSDLMSGVKNG
jgi:hypothetical protein